MRKGSEHFLRVVAAFRTLGAWCHALFVPPPIVPKRRYENSTNIPFVLYSSTHRKCSLNPALIGFLFSKKVRRHDFPLFIRAPDLLGTNFLLFLRINGEMGCG